MHNYFKQHRWSLESSRAWVGVRPFLQWLRSPGFWHYGTIDYYSGRRQSSVTGGTEKIMRGTDKFFPQIREWKRKKVFTPNYGPWLQPFTSFWGTILRGGSMFIAWRESYGADLGSCPQIQRWRPKNKVFGVRSLMFFVLERNSAHAWRGTSSIFGGHRPQNALQWYRAVTFF